MKATTLCIPALSLLAMWIVSCGNQPANNDQSAAATADSVYLEEAWQADSSLFTPESVLWLPESKFFYVSEIGENPGEGAIAQMDGQGKVLNPYWVKGLDAPKGMGLYKDTLFVADLKQLVLIDTRAEKVVRKIAVPGAVFLNDITVGPKGTVYISDTRQGKIYAYKDGAITTFLQQPETKDANGLLLRNDTLWILAAGGLYACPTKDKTLQLFSDGVKGGDGLTFVNDTAQIASVWKGLVYYVSTDGTSRLLLDTQDKGSNTADLHYVPALQLLVVPTFQGQGVTAYRIKHSQVAAANP